MASTGQKKRRGSESEHGASQHPIDVAPLIGARARVVVCRGRRDPDLRLLLFLSLACFGFGVVVYLYHL